LGGRRTALRVRFCGCQDCEGDGRGKGGEAVRPSQPEGGGAGLGEAGAGSVHLVGGPGRTQPAVLADRTSWAVSEVD
jgi:hypothetical protein